MARGFSGSKLPPDFASPPELIRYVFVIFRHGKRSPRSVTPAFGDKEENWPEGLFQLTSQGKRQMYDFGNYIRKRYAKYLTDDPREVVARSLQVDRCFQSMACALAGLYPPKDDWVWNEDLNWQPIQILTDLKEMAEEMRKRAAISKVILEKPSLKDFSLEMSRKIGLDVTTSIRNFAFTLDNLLILKEYDLPVDPWVEDNWDNIMELDTINMDLLTDGMENLLSKELVNAFLDVLKSGSYGDSKPGNKRIQMLCCSDIHLFSLMKIFNPSIKGGPPLGASLFVEVIRRGTGDSVEITYLPKTGKELEVITIPTGSEQPTSVKDFLTFLESISKIETE